MVEVVTLLLVIIAAVIFLAIGYFIGKIITSHRLKEALPEIRAEAIQKSRAVLTGQFSEQLAPFLPDFPFSPTEARFIGKPIDFVVFEGLDSKDPQEVVFVEVKSGASRTSAVESKLKDVIEKKKVRWFEYRVPEELTRRKG